MSTTQIQMNEISDKALIARAEFLYYFALEVKEKDIAKAQKIMARYEHIRDCLIQRGVWKQK